MSRLVVAGCCGRMGSRIAALSLTSDHSDVLKLTGAVEVPGHPSLGKDLGEVLERGRLGLQITDQLAAAFKDADVLIDFTRPDATLANLALAAKLKKAVVIGTTGLDERGREAVAAASRAIPIVFSPNMSLGVNLLFELAQLAAERLGPEYGVKIVEAHHQHKKDAPSGTAKRLQEVIGGVRHGWGLGKDVPCESIREGEIVGDHTVTFSGKFEVLELTHRALNRDVFALGALKAAAFVAKQPAGLYDMSDVLKATTYDRDRARV